LISFLLINSGLYVIMFFSSVKIVKKTIHYLLENDELSEKLIIVSIAREDISNQKLKFEFIEEREFRLNGQMYDIKKDLSDEDSLRYLCYLDEHENLLEKLFAKFSDSEKDKKSNHLQKITFIPFIGLFFQQTDTTLNFFSELTFEGIRSEQILKNYFEVLTPPPQKLNFNSVS